VIAYLNATIGQFRLRDVSFSLPAGYVMGFIGANGAGIRTSSHLREHRSDPVMRPEF
jgi:ABC-type multidrug transport system ATPase subunit